MTTISVGAPPPAALLLFGELQRKAECVGMYSLVPNRKVHGQPVWRQSHADIWIAKDSCGNWRVQEEADLGTKDSSWLILRDAAAAYPHQSSAVWQEANVTEWVDKPRLRCIADPPPAALLLFGEVQRKAECVGMYSLVPSREAHGQPVWRQSHADIWIAKDSCGNWRVQEEADLGTKDSSWLILRDAAAAYPHQSSAVWQEANVTEWVDRPALRCSIPSSAELLSAVKAAAALPKTPVSVAGLGRLRVELAILERAAISEIEMARTEEAVAAEAELRRALATSFERSHAEAAVAKSFVGSHSVALQIARLEPALLRARDAGVPATVLNVAERMLAEKRRLMLAPVCKAAGVPESTVEALVQSGKPLQQLAALSVRGLASLTGLAHAAAAELHRALEERQQADVKAAEERRQEAAERAAAEQRASEETARAEADKQTADVRSRLEGRLFWALVALSSRSVATEVGESLLHEGLASFADVCGLPRERAAAMLQPALGDAHFELFWQAGQQLATLGGSRESSSLYVSRVSGYADVARHTTYRILSLQVSPDGQVRLHEASRKYSELRAVYDELTFGRSDFTPLAAKPRGFSSSLSADSKSARCREIELFVCEAHDAFGEPPPALLIFLNIEKLSSRRSSQL